MMRFTLLTLVLALASGCVEGPVYDHPPTEKLYASFDLAASELAPFTHDGVTIGVDMVSGHALVQLSFAGKTAASVTIDEVRVAGLGARADVTVTVMPALTLDLVERKDHAGFFSQRREVNFPAPDIGVDAMAEEGAVVTVTWRVGDGSSTSTELHLDRRIAREIAWPT